jgi:predicted adenylyl cyclase CyaB
MKHLNIEIKAKSNQHEKIRAFLQSQGVDFKGIDHQIDTYFNVPNGRLKLREGNIENHLIHYNRENTAGLKQSDVTLCDSNPKSSLKELLTKALGILVVVDKKREIYFIDNVKFHVDVVEDLGTFVEIEAIATDGNISKEKLQEQCDQYMELLDIKEKDLIAGSYSDLLLKRRVKKK